MSIKMNSIEEFQGILKVGGSGLRIGGSKESAGIGETDNPIIRHPITHLPYVPGSSVKGKIRSLLESKYSIDSQNTGKPCTCGTCFICELFGCGSAKKILTPTRIVFRDLQPTDGTKKVWADSGEDSEVKTEVMINRKTGAAYPGALSSTERIPAGSEFDFAFSLRLFEGDDLKDYYGKLAEGFELLEKHYLGGSGSRGYGQVQITTTDGVPMQQHLREVAEGR